MIIGLTQPYFKQPKNYRINMRVALLLCLSLFTTGLWGQQLRPADLVANHQHRLQTYEPVTLFAPAPRRESLDLTHYQFLTLDTEYQAALYHAAPSVLRMTLPDAAGGVPLTLDLVKVEQPAPVVIESHSQAPVRVDPGVHYRGTLRDDPESVVAVSIWDEGLSGLISSPALGGNWVLGPLSDAQGRGSGDPTGYVLYEDAELFQEELFSCGTPDDGQPYATEELRPVPRGRDARW